jgi:hypothetical protein
MSNNKDASIVNNSSETIYVLVDNPNNKFTIEPVAPNAKAENVELVIKPNPDGRITGDSLCIRLPSALIFSPTFSINDSTFNMEEPWSVMQTGYLKFANSYIKDRKYGDVKTLQERFAIEPCFRDIANPEIIAPLQQENIELAQPSTDLAPETITEKPTSHVFKAQISNPSQTKNSMTR